MEKMTNKMALNFVLTNCDMPAEVREKLTKMLEQVEKKSNVIHKPTANQLANDGFKVAILESIEDKALTISEMVDTIPALAELSNQRVSAIVRQMVADGLLTREEVKRKAYFSKAAQ